MNRHARIEIVPADTTTTSTVNGTVRSFWRPPTASDPHYLRLVASNGQCLAVSERYSSRSKARRGVQVWAYAMAELNGGSVFVSKDHVIEVRA